MAPARKSAATRCLIVGTAGWSIPQSSAAHFETAGSHLGRYAHEFGGVEINSSFYRSHKRETYVRWAESTPAGFSFALKLPRTITHENRLRGSKKLFEQFLTETSGLGSKRGPLLVQLPPSLQFERPAISLALFTMVRDRTTARSCVSRGITTWFTAESTRVSLAGRSRRRRSRAARRAPSTRAAGPRWRTTVCTVHRELLVELFG